MNNTEKIILNIQLINIELENAIENGKKIEIPKILKKMSTQYNKLAKAYTEENINEKLD